MSLDAFPRNCWYVLARSEEVSSEGLLDRTILGERLLAYRKSAGAPVVMHNRCPHRSAPLSRGTREGDSIRCGYHGMKFGPDGGCQEIPGQDVIPSKAVVRTYPAHDRYGWLWVWPGDPELADPVLITDLAKAEEPGWRWKSDYFHYRAGAELLHDNLLDFSHIEFVHSQSFGGASWAYTAPDVQRLDKGFRITRWIEAAPVPPFMKDDVPGDFKVDMLNDYSFLVPGVLANLVVMQPSGTGTREAINPEMGPGLFSIQAITPETDNTAHYFFSIAVAADAPEFIMESFLRGTLQAFEEDRIMIEEQQRLLLAEPDEPISRVALKADAPLVQMRGLMRKLAREEREPAPSRQTVPT